MAITFDTDFAGAADTVLTTGFACDVGSIAALYDLVPGSVLELNGANYLRLDGVGVAGRGFAMTGTATVNGTATVDVKTGGAGATSVVLHFFRIQATGNLYALNVDTGTGGVRVDRYAGGVYSGTVCSHASGYAASNDYRIDCTYNGTAFVLYRDGVEVASGTDATWTTAAFPQECYLYNDANATPTLLRRVRVSDTVDVPPGIPALQSPVEIFDTDLTAVELGAIALASEEIAAAGPTIYVIESATALQLTGTTTVTRSAAIASATQLQLTGATAAAATPRVTSATALSLTNAQPVLTGPAISLATALSLAGATDVRQLARILSATQLQLTGEIPVLYIGGTPVYEIVSATQLLLTGAMPMRFDAAGALATSLALQGSTVASTASRIAAATALSFAQAAVVGLNRDVRLATALGLAGASPMLLVPAIAGGTALTLTGVATLQRLLPFGSATQLLLANAIPVVLDTGTPIYVITSATQLQLTGGIGMVQVPRVASATSLALANAQPVVGGPAISLVTALSLAGTILARTDRAIAAGSALGLEGQSLARLSTLVIRSATELRLSGQILIGIVTPTGIAWVTYRTLVAPAVASLIARAPAVRSASRTAPAVRLQRAVLPSLDEVP